MRKPSRSWWTLALSRAMDLRWQSMSHVIYARPTTNVSSARHLHMILHALTSLPPSRETPALTILAHKCDLLKSTASASSEQLAITRVKTILERELEKRRASHANGVGVESLGEEETDSQMGGLECTGSGEFKFAEWEGGEITFAGTSVGVSKASAPLTDEKRPAGDGLSPLREWLEDLA